MAIFNCCDGLGLARQLSDLQMPQVIVMREPVPDKVAQEFLKYFLAAFANDQLLYLAVRHARERLQGIENEFPCASWLPVLCQNPATKPPRWIDLGGSILHCPYKGLSPFQKEDKLVFFGRHAFTQQLVEAVKNKPLVAVIGPSGRGKSSVVFAGLVPDLQQENQWQIAHFRPGQRPFDALAAALLSLVSTQNDPSSLQTLLVQEGLTYPADVGYEVQQELEQSDRLYQIHQLATKLRSSKDALTESISDIRSYSILSTPQPIVLIADQFEELYTLCTDFEERERFLDCLLNAVSDTPSFKLVLTLRSDFYGYAQSYRPFNDALQDNCLNLGSMNEQELREAIVEPARLYGVTLEAGLVDRILDHVGKKPQQNNSSQKSLPDKLPLLEFALKQLWAEATQCGTRQLTNKAYDEIGGIERALGRYAEEAYCRIREESPSHKEQIKRIFTQLVRPGEATGTEHTRRLATRRELGEQNWELVNRLNSEDVRLVVIGYDEATKEETVEVVHEALIRGWERLRNWVKRDLAFRIWQERLRRTMHEWEMSNYDDGDLLSNARLAEAEFWLDKRLQDVSAAEQDFVKKGLELRDRHLQEQEERRQRELEAARQLAEASEARSRAAQIMNIVAFIAITLVSAAAIVTLFQWKKAQLQSKNQAIQIKITQANTMLELDKLMESIKVGKKLQKLRQSGQATDDTVLQVSKGLQQAVDTVREKNRLNGHNHKVHSLSFSPDGKTIATASADKTVKLWRLNGHLITTFKGHSDEVYSVSFSPDGETIATASADGTVKLWRRNGSLIKTLTGHSDSPLGNSFASRVYAVSFSPDGKTIATASADRTVKLWRRDGLLITTLTGHSNEVLGVAFSPNGQIIASASEDNTVKLWKSDGSLIKTLTGHSDRVYAVNFSPNGQMIASASEDNTVKLWKPDGSLIKTLTGHRYKVHGVSFSPDGQTISTASGDNTIKLWRHDGSLMNTLTGHSNEVLQVSFSPDGQTIASASADKTVKLWKLKYSIGHRAPVWDLSIRPDNQTIVTASEDKTIKLWKLDGSLIDTLTGHKAGVTDVDFNLDKKTFVSASEDKTIKLWSYDERKIIRTLSGHTAGVNGVIFNPKNNQMIASASKDKTVRLWNLSDGSSQEIGKHDAEVSDVAFSSDGKIIASASWDNTIKFWRVSGELIKTLRGHTAAINDITYSRDGEFLASGSSDTTVKVWRLKDYKLIATLKGHSAGITDVNFSPDGQRIISASDDKTIKIWDWQKETLIDTRNRHSAGVTDVNMSKDEAGKIIASASTDGTVVVWNWTLELNDLLKNGCSWVRQYLKNSNNGMSQNDSQRQVCDDV